MVGAERDREIISTLTPAQVAAFAKKAASGKKLFDGNGLHLFISQAGTAIWRIKYRLSGKERLYSVGPYPEISLGDARADRDKVRKWLREGRDPVQARLVERAAASTAAADTFAAVAEEWLDLRRSDWSAIHFEKSRQALERDVFPALGALPVADITPAMVSAVIKSIARRGARDTAGKILQHVRGIFELAQTKGLRDNPATPARAVLGRRPRQVRRPAFLKWDQLGAVLRGAEKARLSPVVRLAHRLCAFTAARISNVVQAEWKEFDLDATPALWVIPRKKMKSQDREHDHKVILGSTIAAGLRQWRALIGGQGFLFPSPAGGKHITRESIEKAYRVTLGLEDKHTPHGWRAALSTLARDEGHDRDVVELALDHIHDSDVVRAYDRGERLQQRIKLMNWWDGELARAERGADVIPMKSTA